MLGSALEARVPALMQQDTKWVPILSRVIVDILSDGVTFEGSEAEATQRWGDRLKREKEEQRL